MGQIMNDEIVIQGVLAEHANAWWPLVGEWCESALAHGGNLIMIEDVQAAVSRRDMQLWVIHNGPAITAVCVTEVMNWPRAKVLTALIVAGENMPAWVEQLDALLMDYARHCGCSVLDAHGRHGWKKTLEKLGWKSAAVTYAKEVENG